MNIPAMETRISMVGSLQPVTLLKVEPIKSFFREIPMKTAALEALLVGSLQQATLLKVESIKNVSLRNLHNFGSYLL